MEAHEVTNTVRCPQCGFLSPADEDGMPTVGTTFLYFNNRKMDQPRFRCLQCARNFTVGWHGRPQGRTYAKKRNVDLVELLGVHRQCPNPECGVHDNAPFKYYNNQNNLRPHFKCKSCDAGFQMRVEHDETTGAVRLVHNGRAQRQGGPLRTKRAKVDSVCQCGGDSMQLTPPSEQSEVWMSDEDATFASMLEADLGCNVVPDHLSFGESNTYTAGVSAMDPRLCRPFQSLQQPDEWQVHSHESYSSSSSEQQQQQSFVRSLEEASDDFEDEEMKVNTTEGNLVDSTEAPSAAEIGGDARFAAPLRNFNNMAEFGHLDSACVDVDKVYDDLFGYYN